MPAAEDAYCRITERFHKRGPETLFKLGYTAAFFLGEYDKTTMPLDIDDWREIRETIEDASEAIDINILTRLMDNLLSLGLLQ
jgi:hypothetical protein